MEYGGTRCTGPTWTKLVPRSPTWTNLAKLVVVLLCFAFLESTFDQLGPSWSSTLSHSIVYFLSSLRGQTAKTLICTKSGVSADSRKSAEKCRKVRRTALFAHFLYTFCAKSAVLRTFRHFSALFLESAETPLFVQINVLAVWPLRLDRKYTTTVFRALPRKVFETGRTGVCRPVSHGSPVFYCRKLTDKGTFARTSAGCPRDS